MKHRKIQLLAWLAVLSIVIAGDALAQPTMPSLVTQQSRLSTGGANPTYVQQRAKAGIAASTNAYFWDQAPTPAAGVNYSMWLDANNNIEISQPFGLTAGAPGTGGAFYLYRVNATGNGLEWVKPSAFIQANNGLSIDSTTIPGTDIVQFGGPTASPSQLLNDRFIDQAAHSVNFTGAANSSMNIGSGNIYNLTVDVGTAAGGNITLKNILPNLTDTMMLTLDGTGNVKTRPISSLVSAENGTSIDLANGFVQLGGTLLKNTSIAQATFSMDWTGGTMNMGAGGAGYNLNVDVGTGAGAGNVNLKNILGNNADTLMLTLDDNGNVKTRPLSTLVNADNGLIITPSQVVELGAASSGGANLLHNSFVTLATKGLTFDGVGNFNVGDGTNAQNIAIDPSAGGTFEIHHLLPTTSDTKLLVLGGSDSVLTRDLSTLVVADNGLTINNTGGFVELGGPTAAGAGTFLTDRFVNLSSHAMNFIGAGDFKVGDGTGVQNITLDPSSTGSTNLKNLAPITPAATNRFVVLDATDKAFTRTLSSFVLANEGTTIDSTTTPGVSTVQLGDVTDGQSQITTNRFIQFTGASSSLTFDGTGTLAMGTAGNLEVDINTKASNMKIQGNNLDNTSINNFAWIDSTTNIVHRTTTAALGRNNAAVDFVAIDPTNGNIVRAVSPTAGMFKGHIPWTAWNQTITLPGTENLVTGASITVTIENHNSQGTVAVQVTNVTPGLGGSFDIAAADDPSVVPGSFINYVIINP